MVELLSILRESPLLFLVLMLNIAIISYIAIYVTVYVFKKKRPERSISFAFWKARTGRRKPEIKGIEDVYTLIMKSLRKEGVLHQSDGIGFNARLKALLRVREEKKKFLEEFFEIYEGKMYGNRQIKNESKVASDILDRYLSV